MPQDRYTTAHLNSRSYTLNGIQLERIRKRTRKYINSDDWLKYFTYNILWLQWNLTLWLNSILYRVSRSNEWMNKRTNESMNRWIDNILLLLLLWLFTRRICLRAPAYSTHMTPTRIQDEIVCKREKKTTSRN